MPQGYFAAGDAYTCHYDEIIEGIKWKVKIIDNTLLYEKSIQQHFYNVFDYPDPVCQEWNHYPC